MMEWIFAGVSLAAAAVATFTQNMKTAILALWVAGLGVGCIYLTLEAEFLAVIQWIVSTLLTITFVFFAVMFGEYNPSPRNRSKYEFIRIFLSILVGTGFSGIIWLGATGLGTGQVLLTGHVTDLKTLGQLLIQKHFISLEVLALTLFLVLVGGGAVARFERRDSQ